MRNKSSIFFMVVALATFSFQSFAQTFGVKAGLNMSKITNVEDAKMLLGFHAGAVVDVEIVDQFSVGTGLILSTKGVKIEESVEEFGAKMTFTAKLVPMYLEIPVNAKYKIDLGGKNLYFAAGPYLAFGIAGKIKSKIEASGNKPGGLEINAVNEDIKWGDDGDLKRMDFGINVGAGIELGSIGIGVQYGLGLNRLSPMGIDDENNRNRVLSLSVSYKFAK